MGYEYWVAYSHARGFGAIPWTTNEPITTTEQLDEVAGVIERSRRLARGEAVVLTWTLLRMIPSVEMTP